MVKKNSKKQRDMESVVLSIMELICPYVLKKIKQDDFFKNCLRMKMATVANVPTDSEGNLVSNISKHVDIILPYDTVSFAALNNTGVELAVGDTICFMYWIDLKNSVIMIKK